MKKRGKAKEGELHTPEENEDINSTVWQRWRGRDGQREDWLAGSTSGMAPLLTSRSLKLTAQGSGVSERSPTVTQKLTVWRTKEAETKGKSTGWTVLTEAIS